MSDDIVVNTDELTANDTVVVDMPQIGGTVEITFGVGPQGLEGDRGPRGYLFTPTVSEEGVISWTNDGNLPNPEPISIKGPKGDKGDPISVHICSSGEYDPTTRVPTVQNPEANVFYLVPAEDPQSSDLFSEWVYINGAWELFGSAKVEVPVQDVQVNGTSVVTDGVAEIPLANNSTPGIMRVSSSRGFQLDNGSLAFVNASDIQLKAGTNQYRPITPSTQYAAAFYGLAKAAGDTTQSQSSNPVGTYTDEAKAAIQQMLDVPSNDDIPEAPVQDVQVDGVSALDAQGVANVPIASSSALGVVKSNPDGGVAVGFNGALRTDGATVSHIKAQSNTYKPITPSNEYAAAFYGLATASGDTTQKSSANPVGTYTDEAKAAIQQMLGVPQVATTEEVEEIITVYEEDEDMVFEMTFENLGHGEGRYTSVATTETIMAAYYAGKHVVLHFPEVSDFGVIGECWASIIGANKDDNRLYCSTMLNGEQLTEMIISGDHVLVEIFS